MKKLLYDIQLTLLLTVVWLILFERFSIFLLISGLIVSLIAIRVSERYFLGFNFYDRYPFNLFSMLFYIVMLIVEIYSTGLSTLAKIIYGDVHTDVVKINTKLTSDFKKSILANSITLTPGTVTLDVHDQEISVLWLDVKTKNPILAGELIKGKLEKRLR